jgi:hypothetical protein
MVPRRDVSQFKQACKQAGIGEPEINQASEDLHAEKRASGERGHWPYGKLINWLRDWKEDRWQA